MTRRQRTDILRDALASIDMASNLLSHFLPIAQHLDRLPKADRLPLDFADHDNDPEVASGNGIRSNSRAHASPSGADRLVSMMA